MDDELIPHRLTLVFNEDNHVIRPNDPWRAYDALRRSQAHQAISCPLAIAILEADFTRSDHLSLPSRPSLIHSLQFVNPYELEAFDSWCHSGATELADTFSNMWLERLPPQPLTDFIVEAFNLFAIKHTDEELRSFYRIDQRTTG